MKTILPGRDTNSSEDSIFNWTCKHLINSLIIISLLFFVDEMNTRERKIEDLEERLNKQASEIKLITETTLGWFSNAYK